jgi:deoxyhypusine synthase
MEKKENLLSKEIQHINLTRNSKISDIIKAFQNTSFQSRNLAKCCTTLKSMLADNDAVIFFGLSGAMVPGGMRKVIVDMIKYNIIDVLVSTGANMYHDFFESQGYHHYISPEEIDDNELCVLGIDRIYDVIADDDLFSSTDMFFADFAETLEKRDYSTREFFEELGKTIKDPDSIIKAAFEYSVPIFCPTIHDSGIGIGISVYYTKHKSQERFYLDLIRDNFEIMQIDNLARTSGAFFVGGGSPKNYIQQIEPLLSINGMKSVGHKYAIQITTDDPKWGGLSGCTFEEGKSWGKIGAQSQTATVYLDATIGLPLLIAAIMEDEKILKNRARRAFDWDGPDLKNIKICQR